MAHVILNVFILLTAFEVACGIRDDGCSMTINCS
jgi:hypothetical protein